MRRVGAPIAKAAVYAFAFAFWVFAILFTYNLMGMIARGHIEKYWFALLILMFGLGVLFAEFSRYLIRLGVPEAAALFQPAMPTDTDAQNSNPLTTKDTTAMAKNENPSFTFSQPVTINASTNHNAPGGIIGNAPITIHQHFDKSQPASPTIDAEILEEATVVPRAKMASLDEICNYAETLLGGAIAENTIRNVLERANVESCGKEIRGRARPKLYPKIQAEKVITDYVNTRKRK